MDILVRQMMERQGITEHLAVEVRAEVHLAVVHMGAVILAVVLTAEILMGIMVQVQVLLVMSKRDFLH